MSRTSTAKNGQERIVSDRDNLKHLQYFRMGNGDTVTNANRLQTVNAL